MSDGIAPEPLTLWAGFEFANDDEANVGRAFSLEWREYFELLAAGGKASIASPFLGRAVLATTGPISVPTPPEALQGASAGRDLACNWALAYQRVTRLGPEETEPYAVYFVGVNPPPGANAEEMAAFNDFYATVHLPEVAERRHCLGASRYELDQEVAAPGSVTPMFLAAYEVDERWSTRRRHIGGSYARGPAVWQKHTTPWRDWYRRVIE